MGPYCNFCDRRCFVYLPDDTPEEAIAAYRHDGRMITIIATCQAGQRFEKEKIGWCLDDIRAAIAKSKGEKP